MRRSKSSLVLEGKAFQAHLSYKARKRDNELSQRCVRCPNTVEDGYACCYACRAKMAAGKRIALEHGLCRDCWTEPVMPGKRRCERHESLRQRAFSTTYTRRLVRHQCVRCGKARPYAGLTRCQKCTAKDRHYRQAKRRVSAED
jgi:hypothetical protein